MSHKAFLTGATGFLGRHLVDVLLERGWQVTAMVRDVAAAEQLFDRRINLVSADLTDSASVKAAMPENFDGVFHVAADTSTWSRDNERQTWVNVDGTQAVIDATLARNAKRMVHVSSISAYGHHSDLIDEHSSQNGFGSWVNYAHTKAVGENRVREACGQDLDAVIVNPTHIIGRYDDQNWARLILKTAENTLPGIPHGTGNFANGRAVAEAIETAFHKGARGENYILGGPHHSMSEFLHEVAEQLDQPLRARPVPVWAMKILVFFGDIASAITGKRPQLTREEANFANEQINASSIKARQALDYREEPLSVSIAQSIAYLRETGALKL